MYNHIMLFCGGIAFLFDQTMHYRFPNETAHICLKFFNHFNSGSIGVYFLSFYFNSLVPDTKWDNILVCPFKGSWL